MQRWIVLGAAVMALILGGAGFGYWTYKQNRPHPLWVPLPINPEMPGDKRTEIARELRAKLVAREILVQVSKDLGLPGILNFPSDGAAADHLSRIVFVNVGEADSPTGTKIPALHIGVRGKKKDHEISGKIAVRLMQDVWRMLGVQPPTKE